MLKIIYLLSKAHGFFKPLDFIIETFCRIFFQRMWESYFFQYVNSYLKFNASQKFYDDPERFLKHMAIVLKSPSNGQKGIINIAYNYAFPTFFALFDYRKVLNDYHLVLEPSTARYFMPDLLIIKALEDQVYIQTGEERDRLFLERFIPNAKPIAVAANWWIDSRIFCPDTAVKKDIDIIMVSSWLRLKRHYLLFQALGKLKQKGIRLSCVLVGYPIDMTKEDIISLAEQYGVIDQIELYEWLTQEEIAKLYQRSRLNLLLSKREGFNRSVIEGLHADVPCLIREGFNFGDKYEYINSKTGGYFNDNTLEQDIQKALNNLEKYRPNQWLNENQMTAHFAAQKLGADIFNCDVNSVATKVSALDGMEYWEQNDNKRFQHDYAFLMSCVKDLSDSEHVP